MKTIQAAVPPPPVTIQDTGLDRYLRKSSQKYTYELQLFIGAGRDLTDGHISKG